jgi:GAF domain-containing protein
MMTPPTPHDETARLAALRELLVLDTPPEQRFERIVQFAAAEFEVPIALISLVDAERQWFKARVGLDACETSRDISFCGHAIHGRGALVIPDALSDPRFRDNPLVTGEPHIRFYAGMPIHVAGTQSAVGTLCLIDRVPRQMDAMELAILGALRDLVVEQLAAAPSEAGR